MEYIKAIKLNYNTGSKDILVDADFRILEGENYGLIGPNGAGKTTMIRMIMGELKPDKGVLSVRKGLKIGYVPQNQDFDGESSIAEFLQADLAPLVNRLSEFEAQMAATEGEALEKLLNDYQHATEAFEDAGGYAAQEKGENLLRRLGLDNALEQKMRTLSGGERSLVFFTRALQADPDLLILDEPGNHLDYLGLAWLEKFLAGYPKTVLIVSHNRYLLDRTCGHLLALFDGQLTQFTGNYSAFRMEKLKKALDDQHDFEAAQKRIKILEKKIQQLQTIAMNQYNPPAVVMNQLGAYKGKLAREKAALKERPKIEQRSIDLDLGGEETKSKIALELRGLDLGFENNPLLDNGRMSIRCNERVALVGPNGCGKSTLLKYVLEHGDWHHETVRVGPSQKIGYLSQVVTFSDSAETIEDEIRSWGALSKDAAFGIAKRFSFTFQDLEKRLSVLSGGEMNRLQLARLMYEETNFLVLDEPTNHMDILSREAIEEALREYEGTLLVVSHDRFFLDRLVERVVEIDNRTLTEYNGNFTEYFRTRYPVLPRLGGKTDSRDKDRRRYADRAESADESVIRIERRIEEAEAERESLESELQQAFNRHDHAEGKKITRKLDKLTQTIERLYAEWEAVG